MNAEYEPAHIKNMPMYRGAVVCVLMAMTFPIISTSSGQTIRLARWSVYVAMKELPRDVRNPKT